MEIKSKFFTSIISKIIEKALKKKAGLAIKLDINNIIAECDGDNVHVKINAEGDITKEDIKKLIFKKD